MDGTVRFASGKGYHILLWNTSILGKIRAEYAGFFFEHEMRNLMETNKKSPHPPFVRRQMGDKEIIIVDRRTVYGSSEVTAMPWA